MSPFPVLDREHSPTILVSCDKILLLQWPVPSVRGVFLVYSLNDAAGRENCPSSPYWVTTIQRLALSSAAWDLPSLRSSEISRLWRTESLGKILHDKEGNPVREGCPASSWALVRISPPRVLDHKAALLGGDKTDKASRGSHSQGYPFIPEDEPPHCTSETTLGEQRWFSGSEGSHPDAVLEKHRAVRCEIPQTTST